MPLERHCGEMAESATVARRILVIAITISGILTYTWPNPRHNLTRFLNFFQAGQYLLPGLIHTFKEDGGILSIAKGVGWTFHGPVKPQDKALVGIATKWGSGQVMSSFFLYYLELCNNGEHSTMATVFVILENLVELVAKAFLGKLDMAARFDKAPGRYRHLIVLITSMLTLLMNIRRDRKLKRNFV